MTLMMSVVYKDLWESHVKWILLAYRILFFTSDIKIYIKLCLSRGTEIGPIYFLLLFYKKKFIIMFAARKIFVTLMWICTSRILYWALTSIFLFLVEKILCMSNSVPKSRSNIKIQVEFLKDLIWDLYSSFCYSKF